MDKIFHQIFAERLKHVRYSKTRDERLENQQQELKLKFNTEKNQLSINCDDDNLDLTTFDDFFKSYVECRKDDLPMILKIFEMLGWVIKIVVADKNDDPVFVLIK
jgi:hypothetical protein